MRFEIASDDGGNEMMIEEMMQLGRGALLK
jgi:hypothetical protein